MLYTDVVFLHDRSAMMDFPRYTTTYKLLKNLQKYIQKLTIHAEFISILINEDPVYHIFIKETKQNKNL
jgi:hypothetical protein